MMQTGLLDWQIRFKQLDNGGEGCDQYTEFLISVEQAEAIA
jgi:hypothetical protein